MVNLRIRLALMTGVIAVAACSSPSVTSEPAETVSTRSAVEPVTLGEVAIGDCFNDGDVVPETGRIDGVFLVGCDVAHQYEMYAHETLPDALGTPYPGDQAMADAGDELCRALFEDYVGREYEASEYWFWYWTPDAVTWDFLRRVDCAVGYEDQSLQPPGSARGSGK